MMLAGTSAMSESNSVLQTGSKRNQPKTFEPAKPTEHLPRLIEGWRVLVDQRLTLPAHEAELARAVDFLQSRLLDIKMLVSPGIVKDLQKVTLVLDLSHGKLRPMQYHPDAGWLAENGYSTNLAKCVHLPIAADLLTARNINQQPMVILHELAHAYHDQVLGFDEPRILRAYEAFKKSGRGEQALLYDGTKTRHYGLTDQKEFFAEMTEAYFGMNDFFPFNRAELMTAEPEIFELMQAIWGPVAGVSKVRAKGSERKPAPSGSSSQHRNPSAGAREDLACRKGTSFFRNWRAAGACLEGDGRLPSNQTLPLVSGGIAAPRG
jgi:hypothetical protein